MPDRRAVTGSSTESPWERSIQRYLESLILERGLSERTVDAYGSDLARLGDSLDKLGTDPLEADQAAFFQHVDTVRQELTAMYEQLRDREAAATELHRQAADARSAAQAAHDEASAARCDA